MPGKYTLNLPFSKLAKKMMTIRDFKHLVNLADFLDVTPQSLNKFRVEGRFPTNLAIKFAEKNNSSLDELLGEFLNIPSIKGKDKTSAAVEGEDSDALIIRYASGELGDRPEIQKISLEVAKPWVQENFGENQKDLLVWIMNADNMTPTIQRGSLLLIDTRSDSIQEDGIYAISTAGKVMIRRIQEGIDGTLNILNDNKFYESHSINPRNLSEEGLKVLGRIVFVGRPI